MSKPPEVVLCEVAKDHKPPIIVTYFYDLEAKPIGADDKSAQPTSELASIESLSYDSASNLVTEGTNEPSIPGDHFKFVTREWNSETALQYNRHNALRRPQWSLDEPGPASVCR
jgi:hypothetical protein